MSEPLLEVHGLTTSFGAEGRSFRAVDDVSFTVARGERLGIVGESGSGKTVTALSILGLVDPPGRIESGDIVFAGRNLVGLPEREYRRVRGGEIAMIHQDPLSALNPVRRVGDQLVEAIRAHGAMTREAARERALELLEIARLPEPARRIDSYPHELSGGMRQRVMIAMALAADPALLIADEPTTALDVTIQAQVMDLLAGLAEERSTAVILITHDLALIAGFADRVAVMYAGRIVELALRDTLFASPSHPYTRGLLESVSRLDRPRSRRLPTIQGQPPRLEHLPAGCAFHPRCGLQRGRAVCDEVRPELEERRPGDDQLVACHFAGEPEGAVS
ncbi:MAG TPA: ABC transporter ATP-binding protein [Candidatus Dormibacteraeota bacterium]|nr:ABC transporter ATP-binding protein [Candidatus Dormibacteraeota bacterium]